MSIDDIRKELEKTSNKVAFLKQKLEEATEIEKSEIRKLYIEELRKKVQVKLENFEPVEFRLSYDSMSEGLEPIYFWILDFLRSDEPSGLGLEVSKVEEAFEATTSSGYFGEMGLRRSTMEDRAMKMLQTVNTVVRSIINLIYDLKEFKIRIEHYDDLKSDDPTKREAAEFALKGIWMDQVDIQKGRAAINTMAQQLQFVTLRDAFFVAKTLDDIKKIDLNDRVKRILERKLEEYLKWKKYSEEELKKRYDIERQYLKSQVDSLKLYTKWTRPYLKAAQQLKMKEFNSPDLVAAFDNMQMELTLFGKGEIKPSSVFEEYGTLKLKKKVYGCVEVNFKFRTIPQALRTQTGSHYVHSGTTDITFRAFVFTDDELKELEAQELYEDMEIVEQLTNVSLKALEKDLDEYLKEPKKEEEKKKPKEFKFKIPFAEPVKEFFNITKAVNKGFMDLLHLKAGERDYEISLIRKKAEETSLKNAFVVYDVYKKSHGMLSW